MVSQSTAPETQVLTNVEDDVARLPKESYSMTSGNGTIGLPVNYRAFGCCVTLICDAGRWVMTRGSDMHSNRSKAKNKTTFLVAEVMVKSENVAIK